MMSATSYQGGEADSTEPPRSDVSVAATAVASISSRVSTGRRKPTSSTKILSLPLPLSTEQHEDSTSHSPTAAGIPKPPPLGINEKHPAMREMIFNFIFGKSKALVCGQLLSLVLAGSGAIQSALYLDCHLSAPTFSMLSFYFPLCIVCLARLIWKESDCKLISRREKSVTNTEQGGLSMHQSGNDGQSNETRATENNVTRHSSGNEGQIPAIRATMEKRNHLLSTCPMSQYPPPKETIEDDHFYGVINDVGSNNVANAQTSSKTKVYSLFGLVPLQSSLRNYATIAVVDVYANYTTIMAFKYTTITSVSLFDALAIPSAIIVSRIFFGRRYTKIHLVGVLVCSIGITVNVFQDYREDKHLEEASDDEESTQEELIQGEYPHKMRGDIMAIIAGILFGISNTLQEVTLRNSTLTEYLGCMTFFASIISFIQVMILERDEIMAFFGQSASDTCSESEGLILFFAFAVGGMVNYLGISAFLQISDAAFLNLSLLTGDAWAVAFSVFAEGIIPPTSFYVALVITISGVFIYETAPSPVVASQEEFTGEIELRETDVSPEGEEQEGHVLT